MCGTMLLPRFSGPEKEVEPRTWKIFISARSKTIHRPNYDGEFFVTRNK